LFAQSVTSADIEALVYKYRRNLVNSHLEHLILSYLEKQSICGYDVISIVHDRFHVLLSPGQVYPVINYLVDHGLVSKLKQERRVILGLTPSGLQLLRAWKHELSSIQLQLINQAVLGPDVTA
jgi:DNA-binding PadR family transcriptional regulator